MVGSVPADTLGAPHWRGTALAQQFVYTMQDLGRIVPPDRVILEDITLDDAQWQSGTLDLPIDAPTSLATLDIAAQRKYLRRMTNPSYKDGME